MADDMSEMEMDDGSSWSETESTVSTGFSRSVRSKSTTLSGMYCVFVFSVLYLERRPFLKSGLGSRLPFLKARLRLSYERLLLSSFAYYFPLTLLSRSLFRHLMQQPG